jgi:glycosyltransferase involved in cell wall biosynthesis
MTRTVVYDLTPLDTQSRYRGHGRYLRDLARGLAKLPASERAGIRLLGLTHLHADGSYRVTEDLASFEGSPELPAPTHLDHHRWAYKRRLVLWRALRALAADVVHLGDSTGVPLFLSLARAGRLAGRTRKIVTCHDLTPAHWPDRYFGLDHFGPYVGRKIEDRRYRSADLLVAISDATRDDVIRFSRVAPERVVRVHNGIELEPWERVPPEGDDAIVARHGLARTPYVLYVGDAAWHKNIEGMMGGLAEARLRGVDLHLAYAGLLSPEREAKVRAEAERAGVADRLLRLGYVADHDLPSLYRGAVAHLFVSRAEGFGMPVVEAMASGAAVVTSTARALVEVGGDAVVAVDPEDHAAIGAALVAVASDPQRRAELVARGRERARRFTNLEQARGYVRAYRQAAEL